VLLAGVCWLSLFLPCWLFPVDYSRSHLDPRSRLAAQECRQLSSLSMSQECKADNEDTAAKASRGIRFGNELVARQVFSMNRVTDDSSWWRLHDQMNEWCVKLGYEKFLSKVMQKNEMRERLMMSREDPAERRDEAAAMLRPESVVTFANEAAVEGAGKDKDKDKSAVKGACKNKGNDQGKAMVKGTHQGSDQGSDDAEEEAVWLALWIQVRFELTNGNTVTLNRASGKGTVKGTVEGKYKLVSKAVVKARQEEEEAVWLAFREQVRIELIKGNEVTLTSGPSDKATSGPVKGPLASMNLGSHEEGSDKGGSDKDKDSSDDGRRGASSSKE
jgi:hypothetical protein